MPAASSYTNTTLTHGNASYDQVWLRDQEPGHSQGEENQFVPLQQQRQFVRQHSSQGTWQPTSLLPQASVSAATLAVGAAKEPSRDMVSF